MHPIILASQSIRRKQLLETASIPFEIVIKGIEETYPPNMKAVEVPSYIAYKKAVAVKEYLQNAYYGLHAQKTVLAADTLVILDNVLIGKPQYRHEAIDMLMKLSGKTHHVVTGVTILHTHGEVIFSDTTEVTFRTLVKEQVEWYVDKYSPYDKAGAYAIQEWIGMAGVKSINGDFYNVMGLPVGRVMEELNKLV